MDSPVLAMLWVKRIEMETQGSKNREQGANLYNLKISFGSMR